jgi:hypothetical protein
MYNFVTTKQVNLWPNVSHKKPPNAGPINPPAAKEHTKKAEHASFTFKFIYFKLSFYRQYSMIDLLFTFLELMDKKVIQILFHSSTIQK